MGDFDRAAVDACDRIAALDPRSGGRVVAAVMVRNEQDIIERFVRHALGLVDAILVVDHASADATRAILQQLVAEGLPLAVIADGALGYHQSDRMTRLAKIAASRLKAHPFVPLDADEFLIPTKGADLRALLRELPRDDVRVSIWRSYVPVQEDDADEPDVLKRITHRRVREAAPMPKAILGGDVAARLDSRIEIGAHAVVLGADRTITEPNDDRFVLAHFPVRSGPQIVAKVALIKLTLQLSNERPPHAGVHYRWLESIVPLSPTMSRQALQRAALFYGCPSEVEDVELIRDPAPTASDSLRYLADQPANYLAGLESFARALIERLAGEGLPEAEATVVESLVLYENQRLRTALDLIQSELAASDKRADALFLDQRVAEIVARLRSTPEPQRIEEVAELERQAARATELEQRLSSLLQSRSWRLTAPLRQAMTLLRGR